MILIVSINFISFYARSISCFKTIQPVNIMLFFFWLLLDLTTWAAAINVHYGTKYSSQTWDVQRLPVNITAGIFFIKMVSEKTSDGCCSSRQIQGGCLSAAVWVPVTVPMDRLPGWSSVLSGRKWRGLGSANSWAGITPVESLVPSAPHPAAQGLSW